MVLRILPCLGTSSCPVVAGSRLKWWSPPQAGAPPPVSDRDSSTATAHSPLPAGDTIRQLILSSPTSLSLSFRLFLLVFSPPRLAPLQGQSIRARAKTPTALSCLYHQFIFPSTGQVNVRLSASPSLLPSKLYDKKQGQELLSHVTQLDKKKKRERERERVKGK